MSTSYTQQNRQLGVETPLGKDALLLTSFIGQEEISKLFSFELELASDKDSITAKDLVGKLISFRVEMYDRSQRWFCGHCIRFSFTGKDDYLARYRMSIVPWFWFLTKTTDCKIFQNKSVPEIIEEVLGEYDFAKFELDLKESHTKWEYCVQYRETDFNFVSRLMEQEGIFYYFKHSQGSHVMVISDHKGSYVDAAEKEVEFHGKMNAPDLGSLVTAWDHAYEFTSGRYTQNEYYFETPSSPLDTQTNSRVKIGNNTKFEVYDYPGEYEHKGDGQSDTNSRMEAAESRYDTVTGQSLCRSFSPGYKFTLKKHAAGSEQGKKFVITAVQHAANIGASYETGGQTAGAIYTNSFRCLPDAVAAKPDPVTPKPCIHGAQTALVVGPPGEEIYPDKYGRVKVQFYWDRYGQKDEKSSCWIRCAQPGAGKGWGFMSIPRIGQEVLVAYLEGDPDRPLITGCVYNAEQMPPYELPAEKTKTYFKSNSSLGGDGFNEIRFDDKGSEEQFYMHAQKDLDLRVLNDYREIVLNDMHAIVEGNFLRKTIKDDSHLIQGNSIDKVEKELHSTVVEKAQYKYDDELLTKIGAKEHRVVGDDQLMEVGKQVSWKIGTEFHQKVGQLYAVQAGQEVHIKAGMKAVIEAGLELTIKVGSNFVKLDPSGVTIMGTMVRINSGGAPGKGSGVTITEPEKAAPDEPEEPDEADATAVTGQKSCK